MKKATQEDYIKYRMERAWKTFEDAKYLASNKSWTSSMNRLYYACGLFDIEAGKLFGDLFDLRQKGDYDDFLDIEEKHLIPMITKAEQFLNKIQFFLSNDTSS